MDESIKIAPCSTWGLTIGAEEVRKRLSTEAFCRVKRSQIHGVGVFAIKDIPKGTRPWVTGCHHSGEGSVVLSEEDLQLLDEPIRETIKDYNLKTPFGFYISYNELEVLHITQFLNASNQPNLDLSLGEDGEFTTNKDIKTGEELTVDYQKSLENTHLSYNYKYK